MSEYLQAKPAQQLLEQPEHTVTEASQPARHRLPRLLRRPGGIFGLGWLALLVMLSLTASWWIPYGTNDQQLAAALQGPSAQHWLGTDELGRDLLSRIFAAGASTLGASLLTVVVAYAIAVPLALVAAERGGHTETVISRTTEIMMALPGTVIILAFIGVFGVDTVLIMTVLGVLISSGMYRVLLGVARSLREQLYVDAARVNGLGSWRVNLRHVLPGMRTVLAVQAALLFGIGLLIQSGLAFMGFGPKPPAPSWGAMIGTASQHIYDAPWLMVPSGLVLSLTVIAANLVADALTDPEEAPRAAQRAGKRKGGTSAGPAEPDGSGVLDVRDLTVAVDDGPVLVSGVSFRVEPGRVLGLVGESGCGKTMTALAALGLLPAGVAVTGGALYWQGRDLAGLDERHLRPVRGREIAYVSQEPMVALDPMFSVAYQLTGPLRRLRGLSRAEARDGAVSLLKRVGIVDPQAVMRSYPHQLSGGMAQRVAIALALTGGPKLLVADEPTTALDVTVQAEILSLLRSLVSQSGTSVVIVTHDLGVVADLCDDVAVMYAGEIVESGTVTEVLDAPRHPYTKALLGANPHAGEALTPSHRLTAIPGQVPTPGNWPQGCRFRDRCPFATDACGQSVALESADRGGTVRCVRANELAVAAAHPDERTPA
ncbi:dipeptide/oligopeptide/nickel ABC transporter permease/ATP-binding protein [Streptomyces sp. NBC_00075]|uniref:Dipeptide/oligopeptide/nickel ABC transporter permease/ATP-binding protein n=1 Tax=Streptomyces sp. NBC_00093 TaxID=2975649 RepID=A0AAU1ZNQ8_9ACTN